MPAPRYSKSQTLTTRLAEAATQAVARTSSNIVGLNRFYRSLELLLRQADQYRVEGNEEQLYVMLMRYATIIVEYVPKHQEYKKGDPTYGKYRKLLTDGYMPELERLKISIDTRAEAQKASWLPQRSQDATPMSASALPELNWESVSAQNGSLEVPQHFAADQQQQLSVGPAIFPTAPSVPEYPATQNTTDLLSSYPLPTPQRSTSSDLPQISNLSVNSNLKLRPASKEFLSKHSILPTTAFTAAPSSLSQPSAPTSDSLYPSFNPTAAEAVWLQTAVQHSSAAVPSAPPFIDQTVTTSEPSERPNGQASNGVQELMQLSASAPQMVQVQIPQQVTLGPQELQVQDVSMPTEPLPPGATCCTVQPPQQMVEVSAVAQGVKPVEKRKALRDIHISVAMMEEFMRYATNNTRRGIESCGILAGSLSANDSIFTISTLIIPKQTGTSDTVEMLNEEEIFEVQDSRSLYPLGWIHTHPTQTCFLSSVDIHTHCAYQTMLDEAVAIVMAPRDSSKRCGIFRLTTPGGLKLIQACPRRGFHSHPSTSTGQPIYELCGHVYVNPRVKHEVIDLR